MFRLPLAIIAGAALMAGAALAQPAPAPQSSPSLSTARADASLPQPLATSDLGSISAGQGTTYNTVTTQTLGATDTGNSIVAGTVTNGDVNVGAGAFSGFNGVGNFVVNTGNNNIVQGTLSVTVVPLSQ
ncbi:MAG: hypothetical protein ACRED9_02470 [Caulobacteraceae bacterium]